MKPSNSHSLAVIKLLTFIMLGFSASHLSAAELEFTGGSINAAGSWNIVPGPGTQKPTAGDTGIIAADGTIGGSVVNFGDSVVTQTGGTISTSAANNNFNFLGGGIFNLEGGRIETRGLFGNNSTINLSGGFVQLGSTTNDSVAFGSANPAGALTISGTVEITALKSYVIRNENILDIFPDWSGTWTHPSFPAEGSWQESLVSLGILFDGAAITDENFGSIFSVTNEGQTLSLKKPASATPLAISEIKYAPETNTVTLTWNSTLSAIYTINYSSDLNNWDADLSDGITMAGDDEDESDGDFLTVSFSLDDFGLQEPTKLFFRIKPTL
ncbi:MAG: hypothetical protein ABF379_11345 [Akkermansiaceae bacterium]